MNNSLLYELLELDRNATEEAVKKAYRRMALRYSLSHTRRPLSEPP